MPALSSRPQILRSFSSRPLAVELLHELEDFDLDPPLRGPAGALSFHGRPVALHPAASAGCARFDLLLILASSPAGSALRPRSDSSSSSTSSSTASYDARDRRTMPPPPPIHASAHSAARSSRSHRPPPSSSGVAPPLPGYGPPRTRADAVRTPVRREQRPPSERSYSSSSSARREEDEFHPAVASVPPSVHSHAPRSAVPSRIAPPRSVAGSSVAGAGPLPLTAGNLRAVSSRPPSVAPLRAAPPALAPVPGSVASPATTPSAPLPPAPPPQLDAALERIQLSLTALHERLSLLEGGGPSIPTPGGGSTALALVVETVRRLLEAVHLRRRASSSAGNGSPNVALRTRTAGQRSTFASLLWRLVAGLLSSARRIAGDAAVVLALAVLVGRLRGVDVLGLVARRILGSAGTRRVQA